MEYTLGELIKSLKDTQAKRIIIVGNQRSGTRIATHIIAKELDLKCILESDFASSSFNTDYIASAERSGASLTNEVYETFYQDNLEFVLQCPFYTHKAHLLRADAVIFIDRDHKEILASAERVDWLSQQNEKQYKLTIKEMVSVGESINFNNPLTNKYSWIVRKLFWDKYQQNKIGKSAYILKYNALKDHPDFISKSTRDKANNNKGFFPNQITKEIKEEDRLKTPEEIKEDLKGVQDKLISAEGSPYLKPKKPEGAKLIRKTLTPKLCISLLWIYKYYRHHENAAEGKYFTRKDFFSDLLSNKEHKNLVSNYTNLKYWDLLMQMPLSPTEVIYKKGYYGITENGIAFVQREIALPKYALVYKNFAYEHQTIPVRIDEILEEAGYDYNELILP